MQLFKEVRSNRAKSLTNYNSLIFSVPCGPKTKSPEPASTTKLIPNSVDPNKVLCAKMGLPNQIWRPPLLESRRRKLVIASYTKNRQSWSKRIANTHSIVTESIKNWTGRMKSTNRFVDQSNWLILARSGTIYWLPRTLKKGPLSSQWSHW